jgi:rhodanese-related sulfurtransferase
MNLQSLLAFAGDHLMLSLAFVGLTLALAFNEISRLISPVKAVSAAQLTELINRDDALVVDLSATGDFEKGHIAGARNVPMAQFDPENKLLAKVRDLPVVLVCRSGNVSADAAKRLVKAGFRSVHWFDGGVAAWQQAGLPLVKGKA